jgi:hypothetical protein
MLLVGHVVPAWVGVATHELAAAGTAGVGQYSSALSYCSVGIHSLSRLACAACARRFLPVEVFSVFGGVCSGRSFEGGIDELREFVPNRCRRSLFSFSSSATRLSLASNRDSRAFS